MAEVSKSIWRMQYGPDGIAVSIDAHERGDRLTPEQARRLARALNDAADAVETSHWRLDPETGHEDEGYSCSTHNMPWGECPKSTTSGGEGL